MLLGNARNLRVSNHQLRNTHISDTESSGALPVVDADTKKNTTQAVQLFIKVRM